MSRRGESRPALDRPLRRLVWVVPASLCLWILVLAGFSVLLGRIGHEPGVRPLEVSLADLSSGIPGGSPGGRPGPAAGGGTGGNAADRSGLPAPHLPMPRSLTPPPLAAEPPIKAVAPRKRRMPAHPALKRKVEAAISVIPPRTFSDARAQLEEGEAPEPVLLKPKPVAAPAFSPPSMLPAKPEAAPGGAAGSLGSSPNGVGGWWRRRQRRWRNDREWKRRSRRWHGRRLRLRFANVRRSGASAGSDLQGAARVPERGPRPRPGGGGGAESNS